LVPTAQSVTESKEPEPEVPEPESEKPDVLDLAEQDKPVHHAVSEEDSEFLYALRVLFDAEILSKRDHDQVRQRLGGIQTVRERTERWLKRYASARAR
jgi:hypothetical protein